MCDQQDFKHESHQHLSQNTMADAMYLQQRGEQRSNMSNKEDETGTESSAATAIQIVYAPNPDESEDTSAAKEFAVRARGILKSAIQRDDGESQIPIQLMHLNDWEVSILQQGKGDDGESTWAKRLFIFLISCGPDGTVHRSVRKLTKSLKEANGSNNIVDATTAVGLLGHSVCKTSAEQMADQVFAAGRRLCKLLGQLNQAWDDMCDNDLKLETQVELVPPEQEFDPWVQSLGKVLLA